MVLIASLRLIRQVVKRTDRRYFATGPASNQYFSRIGASGKKAVEKTVDPDAQFYTDTPEYPPITVPFENTGPESLQAERKEFAEFVKNLPTVQEKMFTVNPYERPWIEPEKRWHRIHMHPQTEPRAVFRVHAIPDHYNLLPFYQFITNTHCISGLPSNFHQSLNIDREVEEFVPLALELIHNEQQSWEQRRFSSIDYVYNVVDQLANAACSLFLSRFDHLSDSQVTRRSSLQSIWMRGGFHGLYPTDDKKPAKLIDPGWGKEILGDDRRKFGEFVFCLREKLPISIRTKWPLPEVVPLNDPLCRTPVAPFVYPPLTIGLFPDNEEPVFWTPGYEYGDAYEFNSVMFYPIDSVMPNIARYKGANPKDCYEDSLRAASVALSFGTLVGQAHYLGFTQYNDLTYPLTTQVILTDGQFWHFSVYQLNSMGIISNWQEQELRTNLAWCSGSMKLYDSVDSSGQFQGLNVDVLKLVLKFLLLEQVQRPYTEMRPYLLHKNDADENVWKSAQVNADAVTTIRGQVRDEDTS